MTDRNAYTVFPAPQGGFFVIAISDYESEDEQPIWEFASTTLDEALRYIRGKLLPDEMDEYLDRNGGPGPGFDPKTDQRLREYAAFTKTYNP